MFTSQVDRFRAATPHLLLVVDDDEQLAEMLAEMFEHAGYTVKTAHTAAQALDLLNAHRSIVLMLADVRMPDMSGIDLARRAVAKWPGTKVVIMSGFPHVPPHPHRFIAKPFRMAKLLAEVQAELSGT